MNEEIQNNNPDEFEDLPISMVRRAISTGLVQSKAPIPHFYLTAEIDVEKLVAIKKTLNEKQKVIKITYNDILLKLTAQTLKDHLYMTSSFMGEKIRKYKNVHLGFAVKVDDGLLVPVIKNCDKKSIVDIATESKTLTEKAKTKKLRFHERKDAVFTVSNLGMYDIENFSAIINPPESAILAVGSIIRKPVVIREAIEIRSRMKVTLSCDHRVIDGANGASFLQALKFNFENPQIDN